MGEIGKIRRLEKRKCFQKVNVLKTALNIKLSASSNLLDREKRELLSGSRWGNYLEGNRWTKALVPEQHNIQGSGYRISGNMAANRTKWRRIVVVALGSFFS